MAWLVYPQPITIEMIREAVLGGRWAMTRHAREQSGKRRIGDEAVVFGLASGEVLEEYLEDPRGPGALVLGHTDDEKAVHAVCAFDPSGTLLIVTVYDPRLPRWLDERTGSLAG